MYPDTGTNRDSLMTVLELFLYVPSSFFLNYYFFVSCYYNCESKNDIIWSPYFFLLASTFALLLDLSWRRKFGWVLALMRILPIQTECRYQTDWLADINFTVTTRCSSGRMSHRRRCLRVSRALAPPFTWVETWARAHIQTSVKIWFAFSSASHIAAKSYILSLVRSPSHAQRFV